MDPDQPCDPDYCRPYRRAYRSGPIHEHSFGAVGHTVAGLVGGFLSGYFLQTLAITMVTSTGSLNEPRPAEVFMVQALTGLASGAIAMMVVGFIKHTIDHQRASKG